MRRFLLILLVPNVLLTKLLILVITAHILSFLSTDVIGSRGKKSDSWLKGMVQQKELFSANSHHSWI